MERYTSGKCLKGSNIENELTGGMMRKAIPAGIGAKKEQQEQHEQLVEQPSVPCRSEQGQCDAGSCGEETTDREVALSRV